MTDETLVTEGSATIVHDKKKNETFLNPVQEFNRDVSIAVLNVFARKYGRAGGIRILEALAATGLRSVRYAKEVAGLERVVANDIDARAVATIRLNAGRNNVPETLLVPSHGDAVSVMQEHRTAQDFDVVDLDPYGSPASFLDGAVQCVAEGGLLCATFTDMAVLCGAHGDVCYTKYGAVPIRGPTCHEAALRIAVATIEHHANRYRRHVVPLLAISVDFYIRLFVRVFTSAARVNETPEKLAHVASCIGCDTFMLQPIAKSGCRNFQPARLVLPERCPQCRSQFTLGGPIWTAPIEDREWVAEVLEWIRSKPEDSWFKNTRKRLTAVLSVILEEIAEVPLFYCADEMSSTLKLTTPPRHVIEDVFRRAGWKLSVSHTHPQAIKTDAPVAFIWDFMRCWARAHPPQSDPAKSPEGAPNRVILSNPPQSVVDIQAAEASERAQKSGPRFLPNPQENWGPGTRAGRKRVTQDASVDVKAKKPKPETDEASATASTAATATSPTKDEHGDEPQPETAPQP